VVYLVPAVIILPEDEGRDWGEKDWRKGVQGLFFD
jgi:hypothetical protein